VKAEKSSEKFILATTDQCMTKSPYHTIYDPYQNGRKKKFFQYVKSLRRDPSGIPTLEKDGITYATNLSKANVLNDHFYFVFSKDDNDTLPEMADTPYPTMSNVQ